MRVLHVIDSLGASGGAEHGMVREIERFSPDCEQVVVRLFAKDQLDAQLASVGIVVVPLGLESKNAGWNWPTAVKRLRAVARELRPQVIHSSLFAANIVGQMVGRQLEIPVLSTFTLSGDLDLLRKYQPGADSSRASILRSLAAFTAKSDLVRFRALTQDALETNCRLLGLDPSRATVIPRGIPDELRPSELKSRSQLGLPNGLPILVNVGRQTAQKGQVQLLEAFAQVRMMAPSHLVILGRDGDRSDQIRRTITSLDLESDVSLVGYSPDVFHYLAHGSAFVFPSLMEGLGTSVLEAMSLGLSVVAYDIPPVRELTDDGRFATLVPVGDVDAFAAAVARVITEDDKSSTEAQRWVVENHSMASIARRVERLLREVANV